MPTLLRMPAPAAGVQQALLLEWSVDEHAAFAATDVLAVVETDKAVIEIEAETDGVLHRRLVPAGRQIGVGTPIAVIGTAGDAAADIEALAAQAGGAAGSDPAEVSGTPAAAAAPSAPSGQSEPPAPTPPTASPARPAPPSAGTPPVGQRIFASPIARRMAADAGLTLADLVGTGPGGRIVRRDVEVAAAGRRPHPVPPTASGPTAATTTERTPPAAARASAEASTAERTVTDLPHSRIRRAIAARLAESKQTVPHFYLRATARVDALLALRADLNSGTSSGGGQKISLNDLLVRAVARAHRAVPEMNVTYAEEATRRYDYVDVAVAIATDEGLVTPVIRDADRRSITEIAATTADLAHRARHGRLRQQELEGGSITVTNLGMFGTEEFAAIINPPQSAILAVGAARREPAVVTTATGEELAIATVVHLVLSVDHRPLDGVVAARWLDALTTLLEHPARILA